VPGVSYAGSTHNNSSNDTEFMILVTPHRLRSRGGQARTIFVGRGDPQSRGSIGAGAPPEPEPVSPQTQPEQPDQQQPPPQQQQQQPRPVPPPQPQP
jgi:hypothetical protein